MKLTQDPEYQKVLDLNPNYRLPHKPTLLNNQQLDIEIAATGGYEPIPESVRLLGRRGAEQCLQALKYIRSRRDEGF